jgi:hypothetical protein
VTKLSEVKKQTVWTEQSNKSERSVRGAMRRSSSLDAILPYRYSSYQRLFLSRSHLKTAQFHLNSPLFKPFTGHSALLQNLSFVASAIYSLRNAPLTLSGWFCPPMPSTIPAINAISSCNCSGASSLSTSSFLVSFLLMHETKANQTLSSYRYLEPMPLRLPIRRLLNSKEQRATMGNTLLP